MMHGNSKLCCIVILYESNRKKKLVQQKLAQKLTYEDIWACIWPGPLGQLCSSVYAVLLKEDIVHDAG